MTPQELAQILNRDMPELYTVPWQGNITAVMTNAYIDSFSLLLWLGEDNAVSRATAGKIHASFKEAQRRLGNHIVKISPKD